MKIKQTDIKIGVEKPFSVVHISDTHFTLADERNDERKIRLSKEREKVFIPCPEDKLHDSEKYARENGLKIIHTGDFIDFVSEANLDRAKRFIDENDVMFIAGNHEFSLYVGEAFEDETYRNQSLAHVQSFFREDIRFNARQFNGVNFVGIDNGYYRFDTAQLEALKEQVALGMPIVLFMHNPLFEKTLFDCEFINNKGFCANIVGTPDEFFGRNNEKRQPVLKPDAATYEMYEYIKEQPLIKAVLAGHLHYDFESMITDKLPQYVTGIDTIRQINIF